MRQSSSYAIGQLVCVVAAVLITTPVAHAQTPDNAALLYYQAFLEYEEPQGESERVAVNLFQGGRTDANDVITSHIERNRRAIDLAVAAADIAYCDWGYDASRFDIESNPPYFYEIREIGHLIRTEIRWLIEQRDFQTAWDRCMTMRKIAVHAGSDEMWISYLVTLSIDGTAIRCAKEALFLAPSDVNTLTGLRADLTRTTASFPTLAVCARQGFRIRAASFSRNKVQAELRQKLESEEYLEQREEYIEGLLEADEGPDEIIRDYVAMLRNQHKAMERLLQGDEAFFQRNRDYIVNVADRLVFIIESDLTYAQTCAALDDVAQRTEKEIMNDPSASLAVCTDIGGLETTIRSAYEMTIQRQARLNANLAAIDVYMALARTGQLPETLPTDSPRDPFSGLPFDYAKTTDGFTLTCRGQNIPEMETEGYEFKINR